MKINIYSLDDAEEIINGGDWISIREKGYDHLYKKIDEKSDTCLPLCFDDVDPYTVRHNMLHPFYIKQFKDREPIFFNEEMASDIYDYVLGKKEINIHCFAGVSRSQAIGHVINIFFNCLQGNEEEFMNCIPRYSMMNPHVLNVMMNVFKNKINGWS